MEFHQGVKAELLCLGQTLPCYSDPEDNLDLEDNSSYPPKYYVQAHTGAKFSLKVSLAADYDIKGCDLSKSQPTLMECLGASAT